jgi:uncharacterized protein (DUF1684 family)
MQHRLPAASLVVPLLVGSSAACRAEPVAPESVATLSALETETDAWHAGRLEKLRAPHGWLSLVALAWLEPGENRVGRAADAEVSYAGLPVDHVGTIVIEHDAVWFEEADGVVVEGVPDTGLLETDADGSPTVLSIGDVRFHVIDRGGRLAVRMKDPAAPTRVDFAGIERFPVGEDWRFPATFVPAEEGETVDLPTVVDAVVEVPVRGRARFEHAGHAVDAVLYEASAGGSYLRFADATSGSATYPVGRYLYVEPSADGETVVLDFNRAYSPPCAFTPFATCTIPEASNRFPFEVTAGERWAGSH